MTFDPASLSHASPLLVLAVVILVGVGFGSFARRLGLPSITGQIVGGALVGQSGLDWVRDDALHSLQPLTHLALGLIAITVGAHLNLRQLRNAGRRLSALLVTEATITPLLLIAALPLVAGVP